MIKTSFYLFSVSTPYVCVCVCVCVARVVCMCVRVYMCVRTYICVRLCMYVTFRINLAMFRPVFAGGTPGNWAKSKPAFQSSTQNGLAPGLAVDGNHDSHLEDGFCSSTQAGDDHPWWMVDLQETILVTQVLMYNRNNSKRVLPFIV